MAQRWMPPNRCVGRNHSHLPSRDERKAKASAGLCQGLAVQGSLHSAELPRRMEWSPLGEREWAINPKPGRPLPIADDRAVVTAT